MMRHAPAVKRVTDVLLPAPDVTTDTFSPALLQILATQESKVFEAMLVFAIQHVGISTDRASPLHILNMASSIGRENMVLASVLTGRAVGDLPEHYHVDCVDSDASKVADGQRLHSWYRHANTRPHSGQPLPGFHFTHADGRTFLQQCARKYDVVYFGHQNALGERDVWYDLFRGGLGVLTAGGHVILTSYYDREHNQALSVFQTLGAQILVDLQNHAPIERGDIHPVLNQRPAAYRRFAIAAL